MAIFILRRLGMMLLTMVCLTFAVFYLVNLEPNLRKLSISQTNMRATDAMIEGWLVNNGYREPFLERYGVWLGVWPKSPAIDPETGVAKPRFSFCNEPTEPTFAGVIEGDFRVLDQIPQARYRAPPASARPYGPAHVLGHRDDGAGGPRHRRPRRHA